MELDSLAITYLGLCLEAFFFGIYSAIFIMYIQYHASKQRSDMRKTILFFAICALYILSIVTFIFDFVQISLNLKPNLSLANLKVRMKMGIAEFLVIGCCDVIAQSILIYRCWIVWGYNISVVILPIILVLAFLAAWIATIVPITVTQLQIAIIPPWSHSLLLFSLAASITVNALVTGLIVFEIFKVFQGGKMIRNSRRDSTTLGSSSTHGTRLQSIIFILIESGAALFSVQLVRFIVTIVMTSTSMQVFALIVGIHQMLNGLTPTIILVRVSMGLSFHDEKSLVDATMVHLCPPETESTVVIVGPSRRKIRNYLDDDDFNDNITNDMSEKSVDGSSGSRSDRMSGALSLSNPSTNNGSASGSTI